MKYIVKLWCLNPWYRLKMAKLELEAIHMYAEGLRKEVLFKESSAAFFANWMYDIKAFQRATGHFGFPGYNCPRTIAEMYALYESSTYYEHLKKEFDKVYSEKRKS